MEKERGRQLVQLVRELVGARSFSGAEERAAAVAARWMGALGFDRIRVDEYGSVWGCIEGAREGRRVLLDGHLDTVDTGAEDRWSRDPFRAEEVGGRLYGRGTSDMKGALAAMILAAAHFSADCGGDFAGRVFVSCTVCEEVFEGVAARRVSAAVRPDWVIIGESSDLNLNRGQRGRAEIRLWTEGRSAHSSNPGAGRNAVYDMTEIIRGLRQLAPPRDPLLGSGIMELTDIRSDPYPGTSVIPDHCVTTWDRRLLPDETEESVLGRLEERLERIGRDNDGLRADVRCVRDEITCYTGTKLAATRFFPAWSVPEDHPAVTAAVRGLHRAGLRPELSHYSFCTNGSHYAGELGLPTVGFGPSPERRAHTVDEYVQVDDLMSAYRGYRGMLEAMTRRGE